MVNMDFASKYAITKRRGTVRVGDGTAGSGGIISIGVLKKLDDTEILMRSYSTFMQSLVAGVWTNFRTGLSADKKFDFQTIEGVSYFGNAVDDFAWWDGTTLNTSAGNPKGNIYATGFLRLWVAGVIANPNRLNYSGAGTPSDFTIGAGGGNTDFPSRIRSLAGFFTRDGAESLQVFLENGDVWDVGFDSGGIYKKRIRRNVGALSHRATRSLENYNLVLDTFKNIKSVGYEEGFADVRASSRSLFVEDYLRTLTLENSAAIYAYKDYLMAGQDPLGTVNNVELIYREDYNAWRLYTGHQVNDYVVYQNKVHFASATDLNVYRYDSLAYSDDETPIYCRYDTKGFDFNDPIRGKNVRYVKIAGFISENCDIHVKLIGDGHSANPLKTAIIKGNGAYVDPTLVFPWGSAEWGAIPFAGLGGIDSSIQLKPFWVAIQLGAATLDQLTISLENYQTDVDFVITTIKPLYSFLAEERIPVTNQL